MAPEKGCRVQSKYNGHIYPKRHHIEFSYLSYSDGDLIRVHTKFRAKRSINDEERTDDFFWGYHSAAMKPMDVKLSQKHLKLSFEPIWSTYKGVETSERPTGHFLECRNAYRLRAKAGPRMRF